ncbi:MAG: hypothetical protein JOZ83_17470, partial [Silvibacterium sp.]|nr:hypothetical protein [Silvibacterium sp.]
LIDRWLADTLFNGYGQTYENEITWSLATLIIAFPLFLLISRVVVREAAAHPEKLDSGIRKWLTYMALVIAAGIFMGDLITILASLLRGEITSRFLAKAFIVLLLSGGVFYYYFGGLRRTDAAPARFIRDRYMAYLSSAAVVVLVILGFLQVGVPRAQRELRADSQRIHQLYMIAIGIRNQYSNGSLPPSLPPEDSSSRDPVTNAPYEYHPKQGSQYELCATFARPSPPADTTNVDSWRHPSGHHCFQLDAAEQPPFPN